MRPKTHQILTLLCSVSGPALCSIGGLYDWGNANRNTFIFILVGLVVSLVPSIISYYHEIEYERQEPIQLLTEAAFVLLKDIDKNDDLRISLLKVNFTNESSRFEMVSRKSHSTTSIKNISMQTTQGLAGMCFRKKKLITQKEVVDFTQSMADWGFTAQQAKNFDMDRKTYACIPIFSSTDDVIAVLCLDAKRACAISDVHVTTTEALTPFFSRLLTKPVRG